MKKTGPSDDDRSPGLPLVFLPEHCGQGGARESDAGVPAGELVHEPEQANRAPGDPELKRELDPMRPDYNGLPRRRLTIITPRRSSSPSRGHSFRGRGRDRG